ncbi:hypothetical protein [Urechidicola vernalis]|uniref:Uncharacterized protein n=1 Tax=Urechidicola vernalis TaxID=3075600 RepID=A0ABU2Y2U8_9FLAO|nr:hypothetical protein [Urechidicola sp. P050]MDT0551969.1 hypothetical protein [Urechidicola sp. P050]
MGTEIITICATTTTPHPLTLSDNQGHNSNTNAGDKDFTTDVQPGDKVKWKIGPNCAVQSITSITCVNGDNLFSEGPDPKQNGDWEGTISDDATGTEEYTIGYTVGGAPYTQDPKLRIPPSQ